MGAWLNSQFLHGEQGALICTAKIVQSVPDIDSKFYAATQVMDEARHVETYSRYLRTKIEMAYPINKFLKALLDQVIQDSRWDFTYLGMQVMIEGLALAAFALIRDYSTEPLSKAINTYVMQDEARHVAFGRLALRDYYPQLTQAERDEREEFVVEACYLMRNRFMAQEVWERLDLDVERCMQYVEEAEMTREFRAMLFSRIVPTVKDIGLWGPKVQKAYRDLGVLQYEDVDPDQLQAQDEALARSLDTSRGMSPEAEVSARLAGVDPSRALEVEQTITLGAVDRDRELAGGVEVAFVTDEGVVLFQVDLERHATRPGTTELRGRDGVRDQGRALRPRAGLGQELGRHDAQRDPRVDHLARQPLGGLAA